MRNLLKALALFGSGNGNGTGGSADWNASEGEAGHVKNRTHYEETTVISEPLNITWDGNTEGLVSDAGVGAFWKISDLVLTDDEIKLCTVNYSDGTTTNIGESWDDALGTGIAVTEDLTVAFLIVCVRKKGAVFGGLGADITFPETGLYFVANPDFYVSSLTTTEPVPQTKTVVHKLDMKYLPIDEIKAALGI